MGSVAAKLAQVSVAREADLVEQQGHTEFLVESPYFEESFCDCRVGFWYQAYFGDAKIATFKLSSQMQKKTFLFLEVYN